MLDILPCFRDGDGNLISKCGDEELATIAAFASSPEEERCE